MLQTNSIIELNTELNRDTITFGKYKDKTLQEVLKDRAYCIWLLKQDWFQNSYEYLHNRVQEYEPLPYFCKQISPESTDFLSRYQFFHLKPVNDLNIHITDDEKKCYEYYLCMIKDIKNKIITRADTDNPYDIKAPCKWLKRFEDETQLKRNVFKDFLSSYELPNIPYIIERIKKEGGMEYKGAQSFNIAKKRSLDQESYWEKILKEKYGENLGTQYKYNNCIFDFINIHTNTIFEAKLGLKDFDEHQYKKYKIALKKFRIIYLIGKDAVINMEEETMYTTNVDKYETYQFGIISSKHTSMFDQVIKNYIIIQIDDLSTLFVTKIN